MQRIDADSVHAPVRRGGANQNFGLSSRRAVTFVWGVADVASFEETVARSEWCEQVRDSCSHHSDRATVSKDVTPLE